MWRCADVYQERLVRLGGLLSAQPEACILVVAHWGVIRHLSGQEVEMASHTTVHDWRADAWQ
jgi:broad specificity phosphatase PhoE